MGLNIDFRQVYDLLVFIVSQGRLYLVQVLLGKFTGEPDIKTAILVPGQECYFFQVLPAFFGQQLHSVAAFADTEQVLEALVPEVMGQFIPLLRVGRLFPVHDHHLELRDFVDPALVTAAFETG